jgi:integrase/recombinase XerD
MNVQRPNELGKAIERFFREYLPTLRGTSQHTIRNYRDAVVLFLRFTSTQKAKAIQNLDLADFTAQQVRDFLAFLEAERHNGVATRNARLAALHTFARFLVTEQPAYLAELQRVLGVPFKRGARNMPIEYLEHDEVEALLKSIDRSTPSGKRDYALFALMLNTGARVQEILDLRLCDIRADPPYQVRLRGKGGKTRLCPIWPQTARLVQELTRRGAHSRDSESPLFVNRHGARVLD